MKTRVLIIFHLIVYVSVCWSFPFGKSKKDKVTDAILSNKNVSEIVEIQGYDDWETKDFIVKLVLTDGTKLWLRDVDFDLRGKKTKDLHFVEIWLINDFCFVEFEFNYKKYSSLAVSQFQNPPKECVSCIEKLYTEMELV